MSQNTRSAISLAAANRTNTVFQGASALNLDAKGRMTIPARHRDALMVQCEGRATLTRHPHGCLLFFPRPTWEAHREQIAAWPMSARAWQRIFLGNASDVELDTAGRILVAPELRAAVGLQRDVMLLGMGSHFEIWDAAKLAESESAAVAAGMPDVLNDFSF
nr:division/cell wall cluster transcriptional repressor MraZ [Herbaspirillum sp. SJZ102]